MASLESRLFFVTAIILGLTLDPVQRSSQQEKNPPPGPGMETHQRAETEAATPGPVHKQLVERIGRYNTFTRLWVKGEPRAIESTGTARISSILGGRFVLEENSGVLMGHRMKGMRLFGYNNGSRKYESCWVFSGSTAILTMSGTGDEEGKLVNYSGTFDDSSGTQQRLLISIRQVRDDRFTVNIRGADPNMPHYAVQETSYTRKK